MALTVILLNLSLTGFEWSDQGAYRERVDGSSPTSRRQRSRWSIFHINIFLKTFWNKLMRFRHQTSTLAYFVSIFKVKICLWVWLHRSTGIQTSWSGGTCKGKYHVFFKPAFEHGVWLSWPKPRFSKPM